MAVRSTIQRKIARSAQTRHAVRAVKSRIELFDVTKIRRDVQGFAAGTEAVVVDILRTPRLAYNLEVVLATGKTAGLIFSVAPSELELVEKHTVAGSRIVRTKKKPAKS